MFSLLFYALSSSIHMMCEYYLLPIRPCFQSKLYNAFRSGNFRIQSSELNISSPLNDTEKSWYSFGLKYPYEVDLVTWEIGLKGCWRHFGQLTGEAIMMELLFSILTSNRSCASFESICFVIHRRNISVLNSWYIPKSEPSIASYCFKPFEKKLQIYAVFIIIKQALRGTGIGPRFSQSPLL